MKVRSLLVAAAAVTAVALSPGQASAQAPCFGAGYTATLGIGGALNGCFTATLTELGENAGGIGMQYYWLGGTPGAFTGSSGALPANAPNTAGVAFFDDDCGGGGPSFNDFQFCSTSAPHAPVTGIVNQSGEFVIGMFAQDLVSPPQNGGNNYWIYSGAQSRNHYPAPDGFQQILYQLTQGGVPIDGEFLFAWEDINTGCQTVGGSGLHPSLSLFAIEDIGNKQVLNDPNNCNGGASQTPSDDDYNDSYIRLSITGTRLETVTPEPMTMTLMATGLVGLGGASLRRRRNKKN